MATTNFNAHQNHGEIALTVAFLDSVNIPVPTFSGSSEEDVNDFLDRFNRIASLCQLNNEHKVNLLPLLLRENALVLFTSSTH